MSFPLGRPVLAMLLLTVVGGVLVLLIPPRPRADLTVWTFAASQAGIFRGDPAKPRPGPTLIEQYEADTGRQVSIELMGTRSLDVRLLSMLQTDADGPEVPDIVQLEIGSVGKFFRAPLDHVGLLPLNDLLKRDGLDETIVQSRLTPWSKNGVIFGIPTDVHPVTFSYRKDLYDQAGIDLERVETWDQFHEAGLAFQRYWAEHGHPEYRAVELPKSTSWVLEILLLQRGVNLIDAEGEVQLDHPLVVDTLVEYVEMAAGPGNIGGEASVTAGQWVQDFADGYYCALLTPDWRLGYIEGYAPQLAGKVAMRTMPRFDPDDPPTSTWGGTMFGIPANCEDPEEAWDLLKWLMFSEEAMEARRHHTAILPPIKTAWNHPSYDEPDDYWGGQKVGALLVEQARQAPARIVTPFSAVGSAELSHVMVKAINWVEEGNDIANLRPQAEKWLEMAAEDLRRRIEFGEFDEERGS